MKDGMALNTTVRERCEWCLLMAMSERAIQKIFRIPGRNQTQNLRKGWSRALIIKLHELLVLYVAQMGASWVKVYSKPCRIDNLIFV